MITEPTTPQLTIIDTLSGIQITWQGKKDWGRFTSNALSILLNLFVIGVIVYYAGTGFFGEMASQTATLVILVVLGAYQLYRIYRRSRELTGALLDHELIQIDSQAVTIERSGFLNVERQVVYPADKIQSIRTTTLGVTRCFFLSFTTGGEILTRFRMGGDQIFCRGISQDDAAAALGKIHERFPQYRDVKI